MRHAGEMRLSVQVNVQVLTPSGTPLWPRRKRGRAGPDVFTKGEFEFN